LNIGGYLGMPISTIKHSNLSGYGRISTCKSCRFEESAPQLQGYLIFVSLEIHEERGGKKIEEIVSTTTYYRVHCNLKKKIVNSLSSFVVFPNLGFHVNFLSLSVYCVDDSSTPI